VVRFTLNNVVAAELFNNPRLMEIGHCEAGACVVSVAIRVGSGGTLESKGAFNDTSPSMNYYSLNPRSLISSTGFKQTT
jgi:hypothetical protein